MLVVMFQEIIDMNFSDVGGSGDEYEVDYVVDRVAPTGHGQIEQGHLNRSITFMPVKMKRVITRHVLLMIPSVRLTVLPVANTFFTRTLRGF